MKKTSLLAVAAAFGVAACIGAGLFFPGQQVQAAAQKAASVGINATNFPDASFRAYVKQFDTDGNGALSEEERANVDKIEFRDTSAANIKGIEFFPNLERLWCDCNQLTSLNISQNTKLVDLSCAANKLTSLNVSSNILLKELLCSGNSLTSLDVSKNTALTALRCDDNKLSSLDLSKNTNLETITCSFNSLTSLNVKNQKNLDYLACHANKLTSLDLSANVNLTGLHCHTNQLTKLNIKNNHMLELMTCYSNQLTSLDLSGAFNLVDLEAQDNPLPYLDITACPKLLRVAHENQPGVNGSGVFFTKEYGNCYYRLGVPFDCTLQWAPDTVTELKAMSYGTGRTKLVWKAINNADGYMIYAKKNGKYAYVGMTTKTSYVDTKALSDTYNYYWVFPYVKDSAGSMYPGDASNYVYAKGVFSAVNSAKATSVKGGVKLTWNSVTGAEGYLVYGIVDGKPYKFIGMTTKGTTFTDTTASSSAYNYYWVYPYYKDANGKMIVGPAGKYTYGRALK